MDSRKFLRIYEELPYLDNDSENMREYLDSMSQEEDFSKTLTEFVRGKSKILDLCCGKPTKIFPVSEQFPETQFLGVDINPKMARAYNGDNLNFTQGDISQSRDYDVEGIIALHACGDLSDHAVEIAINSDCPIFVVPCCYASMNGQILRPLSRRFSNGKMAEAYESLLRAVKRLESESSSSSLFRILFNQDRVSRLEEEGRKTRLIRFKRLNTPHNIGIIAE